MAKLDLRNAQLFLDDAIIEQSVRMQRIIHQPHKYHGNPVYTVEAPWEGKGIVYLAGVNKSDDIDNEVTVLETTP